MVLGSRALPLGGRARSLRLANNVFRWTTPRVLTTTACASRQHTPVEVPKEAAYPPFARYVHACTVPQDSTLIFTSGQLGITPDGHIPASVEEQTSLAFQNISAVLGVAGASLSHIVRLNAYVSGREHLAGYMRSRDAAIGDLPPTASTLMIVSGFARPELVVEVEAIAALPAPPPGASRAASPSSVTSASTGRRGLHTARTRRLHGARVDASAVSAFVAQLKEGGVDVVCIVAALEKPRRHPPPLSPRARVAAAGDAGRRRQRAA